MPTSSALQTAYTLSLAEDQRAIIQEALSTFINVRSSLPEAREARVLWEMFRDLPQEEARTPGALHGFAL